MDARVPGWAWARPTVAGDAIYAGVVGGAHYLAPRDGGLAAIDRTSGELRWLFRSEHDPALGMYGFASAPAASAACIFAADLAGNVYSFERDN